MWGSFSRARKVQTTVCCKHCGIPLSEYIALADEAMEEFLSSVYCDRM